MFFEKTAILGVGLLGASLALAMKKKGLSHVISGFGRKEENLRKALEKGIIDSYFLDPAEAVKEADLVVFATPVGAFPGIAAAIKDRLKKGSIQTDVGSLKGNLVREMEALLPRFVGCHPISGGERSGIEFASPHLFEGAKCIITKTGETDEDAARAMAGLWTTVGSDVEFMDPEAHDEIYALVSHLPHLVAYALVNTVGDSGSDFIRFAGKGFRDSTRIAMSSPELWRDVCRMNRENLLKYMDIFKSCLKRLEQSLEAGDTPALEREFESARKLRCQLENNH